MHLNHVLWEADHVLRGLLLRNILTKLHELVDILSSALILEHLLLAQIMLKLPLGALSLLSLMHLLHLLLEMRNGLILEHLLQLSQLVSVMLLGCGSIAAELTTRCSKHGRCLEINLLLLIL